VHRLSDASSSTLASTEHAHAQLNLNAGGFIFPRPPKPYRDFRKGRCCIIISIPTAPETPTAACSGYSYPPRVCLRSRPLIFQNIYSHAPAVRPSGSVVTHVTRNDGRLHIYCAHCSERLENKKVLMVNCIKHFSVSIMGISNFVPWKWTLNTSKYILKRCNSGTHVILYLLAKRLYLSESA